MSSDDHWLIGSGSDQPLLLWPVRFDDALKLAYEIVGRNLTLQNGRRMDSPKPTVLLAKAAGVYPT